MFLDEQYFMEFCEGEEKERQNWTKIPIDALKKQENTKKGSRILSNYEITVENWVWSKDLGGTPQCRSAARAVKSQEYGNLGIGESWDSFTLDGFQELWLNISITGDWAVFFPLQ